MEPIFSRRWRFSFNLEALTDIHVGTGAFSVMQDQDEERTRRVQAKSWHQESASLRAYIPATGLKGALRAGTDEESADLLFGTPANENEPRKVDEPSGNGGALIFFGATLQYEAAAADMPHYDPVAGTFTRPMNARDPDTGTVSEKKLYATECIPRGTSFVASGLYLASKDLGDDETQIHKYVVPVLKRMAQSGGFVLGGDKTTMGRARLSSMCIQFQGTVLHSEIEIREGAAIRTVREKKNNLPPILLEQDGPAERTIEINSTGPVLIRDPSRKSDSANGSARENVMTELRYESGDLAGWSKAIRQSLRSLCGYLEATMEYRETPVFDDPFAQYGAYQDLCATQRLFGVTGLSGLISVHVLKAGHDPAERGQYPGLGLDVLTNAVLDTATFFYDCPVGATIEAAIKYDATRAARRLGLVEGDQAEAARESIAEWDARVLGRLNDHVARLGLGAGGKTTCGFGWFDAFDCGFPKV